MKDSKGFLAVLLVLLLVFPALSFSQEVVYFFASPGSGAASGLTWDGENLWSGSVNPSMSTFYNVDTLGNILAHFNWSRLVAGLAWDGEHLWGAEAATGNLYQFNTTGDVLSQLTTSLGAITGITWDGQHLWAIDMATQSVNRLDATGQVISSFTIPTYGGVSTGLTFAGSSLWLSDSYFNRIFQFSISGQVLQDFSGPGVAATELEWDGKYLWVSDIVTDRIYKLKVTPMEQIVQARIEFRPYHWPLAWKDADRESACDSSVEGEDKKDDDDELGYGDDGENEELENWNVENPDTDLEKLACKRKISCFIGNLHLDTASFDVGEILIETIRLNDTVKVLMRKECDEKDDQDDDEDEGKGGVALSLIASYAPGNGQPCFEAKIYRHLDRFEGRVLRVRFDATEAFKTLGPVEGNDTVQVCVTGKLENGLKFKGCTYIVIVGDHPTDVADEPELKPRHFALLGNFPNPFNASTLVKFQLTRPSMVELNVYNILGQKVRTLVKEQMTSGSKQVIWDGTDQKGRQLATGIYFYRLVTVEGRQTGKMTMLR